MVERKPSWRLDDASLTAKENPYTFYKPSAAAISLLRPGNLAKLVFAFDSDDPEAPGAERMWVRIDRIESRRFFGVLDNDPLFIRDLKAGDPIEFDDRHVIQTDIADPSRIRQLRIELVALSRNAYSMERPRLSTYIEKPLIRKTTPVGGSQLATRPTNTWTIQRTALMSRSAPCSEETIHSGIFSTPEPPARIGVTLQTSNLSQ
jgi:hypothetical protein